MTCLPPIHENVKFDPTLKRVKFKVDDELRCALTDQSSAHYWLYDEDEQSEFLFRLFKLIVLGGPVCQYENDINVYLGMRVL